ncbi:hypothetical protein [Bacillus badius]|uniref:Uncharacterized protein n=1 Tax=Bacillus badius TaxID=1455 RepID=A0ABR5AZC0_BACBA|nr:hypothetical protein [Bacillus badius]KIL74941.1 hypothetical protein SD78_2010 [Bacillus badius]KIL80076.1 hypothetical protein SD77_2530 [Bacillus badius]KZN99122.1 hypothetical protein A4244_08510 [Bacillus badius]KZR60100.1 hypothetical protein A3781_07825 [Bacillus badius]MED0665073.1 hypothetical protein [Bacillus badius]
MPWQNKVRRLIGQPVGISFANGQGTSGILCRVAGGKVFVIEYLYKTQFALKQYDYRLIQDINEFPPCQNREPLY